LQLEKKVSIDADYQAQLTKFRAYYERDPTNDEIADFAFEHDRAETDAFWGRRDEGMFGVEPDSTQTQDTSGGAVAGSSNGGASSTLTGVTVTDPAGSTTAPATNTPFVMYGPVDRSSVQDTKGKAKAAPVTAE
jgi:hypothetical protein